MLIRGQIPPYYQEKDIDHDPRELYVKIDTLELQYYKQNLMQNDPYWINITDILQRKVQIRHLIRKLSEIGELSDAEENTIENNLRSVEKIPDLEFVEQTIPITAELKTAIDIFYMVNASGVSLTEAELALAQISGYWPEARETFKQKLEELKSG
jgi:predicted nucleotidyltransferase